MAYEVVCGERYVQIKESVRERISDVYSFKVSVKVALFLVVVVVVVLKGVHEISADEHILYAVDALADEYEWSCKELQEVHKSAS